MKVLYFSVWDKKAQVFGQLYPAPTPGAAERMFAQSLKDPNSMAGQYPADFALFQMCEFDDTDGEVVQSSFPPQLIVEAVSLVSQG